MQDKESSFSAFTTSYDALSNRLSNMVSINSDGNSVVTNALWDTGATTSCISSDVVSDLKLIATGKINIRTPSGGREVNTYIVDVVLPNDVIVNDLQVCDSDIGNQGLGMLIGMDIISKGDFSVTNFGGRTTFSFRYPSRCRVDYVSEIRKENVVGKKHGKGKRKHRR